MLNIVVDRISTPDIDVEALNFRLWMEVQLHVDPPSRKKGFIGGGLAENYRNLGAFNFSDVTIEYLLNEIVRRIKSAAWVTLPPPATLKGAPRDRLWGIVTYQDPPKPLEQLCCLNRKYFQ